MSPIAAPHERRGEAIARATAPRKAIDMLVELTLRPHQRLECWIPCHNRRHASIAVRVYLADPRADVFAQEPHVPQAFFLLDNVVLLPHIASATRRAPQGANACSTI